MPSSIINQEVHTVFVILAETLEGWKNPDTEEGKRVLLQHYAWGAALKEEGKLLLAGPVDFDLTSTHSIDPIGHTTGLILLNTHSRAEAEEWALKDPFHQNGFRRNVVHSLRITMTDKVIGDALQKAILTHLP